MDDQPLNIKEIPSSVESEEALLGALLIAPEYLREVEPLVTHEQFFIQRYGWVYRALQRVTKKNLQIDFLSVTEELDAMNKLAEIGGAAGITRLMSLVPSTLHAETYAKKINETWVRRQLVELSSKVTRMAYGEQWGLDEIQAKSINLLQDVFQGVADNSAGVYAAEAINQQYDHMEQVANGALPGNPTEFVDLDYMLNGGARSGDLVLIAGRPGMGKTALMLDIFAANVQRTQEYEGDEYDAFFSLEMPNDQLTDRLVAKHGINSNNLRSGLLQEVEYPLYTAACESIALQKFILDDTPGLTIEQLRSKLAKLAAKHKLRNVFIDYIQLMTVKGSYENRVQQVSFLSRNLKLLAREFHIVIYAGAQLSRAVEQRANKRPVLSDLRESGSLEQDADIVLFIYRPEVYEDDPNKQNIAEIIVSKHRNGSVGTITLIFRKQFMKFENAQVNKVDLNQVIEPLDTDKMLREITTGD